jgi:hypothetical protein
MTNRETLGRATSFDLVAKATVHVMVADSLRLGAPPKAERHATIVTIFG